MQLTQIPDEALPAAIETVRAKLVPGSMARRVFDRIAATRDLIPLGVDTPAHRQAGIELAHRFGIGTVDEEPQDAWSYDGTNIRTRSEAYVLIHEVGHWLVAAPARRGMLDFGLGAGPESGRKAEADAQLCVDKEEQIEEEALASLIGILWEVELGQPAILAYLEQNWMEGWDRPACAENLEANLALLLQRGLIDADGRPVPPESYLRNHSAAA
ncbi:elongation factor P hydroxylase [Oleisolibacter albus]|uniref:elongation factor P hydroxylase n=1 Tax=Oleisolibacter albus TaxID=2171757 RepID=UPI000DF15EA3|nr:elongation factor P hydroxylase [Oleisolibacter albus]